MGFIDNIKVEGENGIPQSMSIELHNGAVFTARFNEDGAMELQRDGTNTVKGTGVEYLGTATPSYSDELRNTDMYVHLADEINSEYGAGTVPDTYAEYVNEQYDQIWEKAKVSRVVFEASDFIADAEKMRDFKEMDKEAFLASYSYLTEAEYNRTAIEVATQISRFYSDFTDEAENPTVSDIIDEMKWRGVPAVLADYAGDVADWRKSFEGELSESETKASDDLMKLITSSEYERKPSYEYAVEIANSDGEFERQVDVFSEYDEAVRFANSINHDADALVADEQVYVLRIDYDINGEEEGVERVREFSRDERDANELFNEVLTAIGFEIEAYNEGEEKGYRLYDKQFKEYYSVEGEDVIVSSAAEAMEALDTFIYDSYHEDISRELAAYGLIADKSEAKETLGALYEQMTYLVETNKETKGADFAESHKADFEALDLICNRIDEVDMNEAANRQSRQVEKQEKKQKKTKDDKQVKE